MAKELTNEDKKLVAILERYESGESGPSLAKKMGCHPSTFYRRMGDAKKLRTQARRQKSKTDKGTGKAIMKALTTKKTAGKGPSSNRLLVADEEILRLKTDGMSNQEIAEQLGCTDKTIRERLKRAAAAGLVSAKPQLADAMQRVMGDQVLNGADILKLLKARGWEPNTKKNGNDRIYVQATLSTRKDLFERVPKAQGGGRGTYRCKDPLMDKPGSTTPAPTGGKRLLIEAITPKDDRWASMKQIWDVCTRNGITPPVEVAAYFNGRPPAAEGRPVPIVTYSTLKPRERSGRSVTIALDSIPEGATSLRIEF